MKKEDFDALPEEVQNRLAKHAGTAFAYELLRRVAGHFTMSLEPDERPPSAGSCPCSSVCLRGVVESGGREKDLGPCETWPREDCPAYLQAKISAGE
jgi:hypothetical protein